jgi:hypothetical protein
MANLKRDSSGNYVVRFRLAGRGSEWVRRNIGPVSHTDAKRLERRVAGKFMGRILGKLFR